MSRTLPGLNSIVAHSRAATATVPEAGAGSVGSMLLAEDLLLLVTDDASGRLPVPAAQVDAGLGGANLAELTVMNKVGLSGQGDQRKPGRIIVGDPSPAGDEVLDAALQIVIAHQGETPPTVIGPLSKNLRRTLYERLAGARVIRAEQGRTLGLFPTHRWPAQDTGHEGQVRQLVTQALVRQGAPVPSPRPARSGRPPPGPANAGSPHATRRSPQTAARPGCPASTMAERAPQHT